jgi:hypothetical protein
VEFLFIDDFLGLILEGISLLHLVLFLSMSHLAFLFLSVQGRLRLVDVDLAIVKLACDILNHSLALLSGLTSLQDSLLEDLTFFAHFKFGEGRLLIKEFSLLFSLRGRCRALG